MAVTEHMSAFAQPGRDGLVFPSRKGVVLSESTWRYAWIRAREKADTARGTRTDYDRSGQQIGFGEEQPERYRARNVIERCFNDLKQWLGPALRSDTNAWRHTPAFASPPP